MATKKEVIRLKNVTKHYYLGENVVRALDGIDVLINQGGFVSIMGSSGSGKSTMVNLIGSLDTPTNGKIFLDKMDVSKLSESALAQLRGKKTGFIFQQFNLINNLTAKENIALPLMFQGISELERGEKADELLKRVGLEDRGKHYPNQLSGGQQQRVAIARALANDPEVILADEPTGNLDTKTGKIIVNFLEKLHKEGKTIIMVTHDPKLAKKYSDVVYWLKDGKIEKITKKKN